MIGFRTALLLFALLLVLSLFLLHGKLLYLALIIVGALAAKSALHYYRQKL